MRTCTSLRCAMSVVSRNASLVAASSHVSYSGNEVQYVSINGVGITAYEGFISIVGTVGIPLPK